MPRIHRGGARQVMERDIVELSIKSVDNYNLSRFLVIYEDPTYGLCGIDDNGANILNNLYIFNSPAYIYTVDLVIDNRLISLYTTQNRYPDNMNFRQIFLI